MRTNASRLADAQTVARPHLPLLQRQIHAKSVNFTPPVPPTTLALRIPSQFQHFPFGILLANCP